MKTKIWISATVIVFCVLLGLGESSRADVVPGDLIDEGNWEKAAAYLPESVLNWVKKGDLELRIGKITYDRRLFMPPSALESLETNVGKYEIDQADLIIDANTGERPKFIEGIPFPKVSPDDPKAGEKLMYNKDYHSFTMGNMVCPFSAAWVGRKSKWEREIRARYLNFPFEGARNSRKIRNPSGLQRYTMIFVDAPVDIKGTSVLLWRYNDDTQDSNFAYLPAVRRVRRMSPANRSDAFVGTDFCVDDAWGYDGKITACDWRVLRMQKTLAPFSSATPEVTNQNEYGEWMTTASLTDVKHGWEVDGWQGAPWAPVNAIWAECTVYVIETIPKDPYYNYGKQYIWLDTVDWMPKYKIIHDRAGNYWKTFVGNQIGCESPDKSMRYLVTNVHMVVNDRTDHATSMENASPRNIITYFADLDSNDFSLAGFQKFCK